MATGTPLPPDIENGSTQTGDVTSEVGNNEIGGSLPTVALAAGIVGGLVGLIALVSVCICVGCLSRHVKLHVHYGANNTEQREDTRGIATANSSDVVVQANTAYRQRPSNRQQITTTNGIILVQQGMQLNQSHRGLRSQGEEMEYQREAREMMSRNMAYHSRNQTQTEVVQCTPRRHTHFVTPQPHNLQTSHQQRILEDNEDHSYDYIL